jgi:hypothetical protein
MNAHREAPSSDSIRQPAVRHRERYSRPRLQAEGDIRTRLMSGSGQDLETQSPTTIGYQL